MGGKCQLKKIMISLRTLNLGYWPATVIEKLMGKKNSLCFYRENMCIHNAVT
jgi:hypothetical protein